MMAVHGGARAAAAGVTFVLAGCVALAGCASGSLQRGDGPLGGSVRTADDCTALITATLGQVAESVYREAAAGSNVRTGEAQVRGSAALSAALAADDPAAARAAAVALVGEGEIVNLEVLRGRRRLAYVGRRGGLAPTVGVVRNARGAAVGRYVLSVQGERAFREVVGRITGGQVLLRNGPGRASANDAGVGRRSFSFLGEGFSGRPLSVSLVVSQQPLSACAAGREQTEAATLGHAGERIYAEEIRSGRVDRVRRTIESFSALKRAVAAGNRAGMRRAIVALFRSHLHVVRVRIRRAGGGVFDIGGPAVLGPVEGVLRDGRRVVGTVDFALQDDVGYIKLVRRFTGAQVLLREGDRQVLGTLSPGPRSVPAQGTLTYRGRLYEAFSFFVRAFPSGRLRVSLLFGAD